MRCITKKAKWLNEKDLQEYFLILGNLVLELVNDGINDVEFHYEESDSLKKFQFKSDEKEEKEINIFKKCANKFAKKNNDFVFNADGYLLAEIKDENLNLRYKISVSMLFGRIEVNIIHSCYYAEGGSIYNKNSGIDKNFVYECGIRIPFIGLSNDNSIQEIKYNIELHSLKKTNQTSCPQLNYKGKDYGMVSIFNLFKST